MGVVQVHPRQRGAVDCEYATPSTSPSGESSAGTQALMRLLPVSYPAGSCNPTAMPKSVLAQINCETNSDPGGPVTATYSTSQRITI